LVFQLQALNSVFLRAKIAGGKWKNKTPVRQQRIIGGLVADTHQFHNSCPWNEASEIELTSNPVLSAFAGPQRMHQDQAMIRL
jgi:hypothetical protein